MKLPQKTKDKLLVMGTIVAIVYIVYGVLTSVYIVTDKMREMKERIEVLEGENGN